MISGIKRLTKFISPALLATILCAVIVGYLLFIPPVNGLADNGDFLQVLSQNGLYRLSTHGSVYFNYVIEKFGIMQFYNENAVPIYSSQFLFVKAAIALNKVFASSHVFDVRFLGFVYYVFFLGAIYLLTRGLTAPHRHFRNYVLALIIVFVFADTAFTIPFNSFFSEAGTYILMLYCFGLFLLITRKLVKHYRLTTIAFFAASLLLIAVDYHNVPLTLGLLIMACGLLFVFKGRLAQVYVVIGMLALIGMGAFVHQTVATRYQSLNRYQAFTHGVLQTTEPSLKVTAGGIDSQYALMKDNDYYPNTYSAILPDSKYVHRHLISKLNAAWTTGYYFNHFSQFLRLLDDAGKNVMQIRIQSVGNYDATAGKLPGAKTQYFSGYSLLMQSFYPRKYAFNVLIMAALLVVYTIGMVNSFRHRNIEGVLKFFLMLGLLTVVILLPVIDIVSYGTYNLSRNMFPVAVSLSLAWILLIADWMTRRLCGMPAKSDHSVERAPK